VLCYNSVKEIDISLYKKLDFKWLRLYQIYNVNKEKGYYKLKELGLNKALLYKTFFKSRLKLFY